MNDRPTSATWPSLIFCFYLKMLNMSDFKAEVCSLSKSALPFVFSSTNVVHSSSPPLAPLSPRVVF